MSRKIIGVLGGMGPRATVQFESMLLDSLVGNDQDMPTIISINDGSIPDRSSYLLGLGEDPVPSLSKNIKLLESGGASIVCIPCNTACSDEILSRLVCRPTTTLIDLPLSVLQELQRCSVKRTILLATEGTVQSNKYQQFCKAANIECIVPDQALQSCVSEVIMRIKSNESIPDEMIQRLKNSIDKLKVDAVILGCTELPLLKDKIVPGDVIAVDTLQVLVDTTVKLLETE